MTRRGTLAYYLAAWVIGCFIVSLLQWSGDAFAGMIEPASDLLTSYFFSLVFGAAAILLFSFLLRRAMRLARTHNLWIWLLSGAVLGLVLMLVLIGAQSKLLSIQTGEFAEILFGLVLKAADTLSGHNLWQAPVDGAVTALVLCLVDRAFTARNEGAEPKQSPA